jgi:hypothetical protein
VPIGHSAFDFGTRFIDRQKYAKLIPGKDVQDELDKNNVPRNEQEAMSKVLTWAQKTRARADDEIPQEQGFCVPYGFIKEDTYAYREEVELGVRLPSLPDVTFSINSKNAGSLEGEDGWGILKRVKKQQTLSGDEYDGHFLRIGKAPLQTWYNGEEVLARVKSTGGLQFRWGQVGTDGSVANPNELDASMFTKVKGESVGLSDTTSVTDEEAVALWDKLLQSFRFRVPLKGMQSSILPGDICPKTGYWVCPQLNNSETKLFMRQGDLMPGDSYVSETVKREDVVWQFVSDVIPKDS